MRTRRIQALRSRYRLILPGRTVALLVARQRPQIACNRRQVIVAHELRGVVERLGHRAINHRMFVATGLEELHHFRLAPAPQAGVGIVPQARCVPAVEQATGQVRLATFIQGLLVEGQAPWRVATAAMPRALHDVGAAVPQLIFPGLCYVGLAVGKHAIPQRDRPPHIQWPRDRTLDIGLLHRRHALHEERVQGAYIIVAELGIGRVRHRRIQAAPTRRDTLAHRAVEVGEAVAANAGFRVWRDVGGVDRPQRRGHFQATGKGLAVGHAVARHTVAEPGDILASGDQRRVRGDGLGPQRRDRLAGDIPGQQACGDQARQRQPANGSCESTVVHKCSGPGQVKEWRLNGMLRTRCPVNAATALATAGATAGSGGSPIPPIFSPLSITRTCTRAIREGGSTGYKS